MLRSRLHFSAHFSGSSRSASSPARPLPSKRYPYRSMQTTIDLTRSGRALLQPGRQASRCRPRPARTASCAASRCAPRRRRRLFGLDRLRARQSVGRADRPAAGRPALPPCRFRADLAGSRLRERIAAITPSEGFAPERLPSSRGGRLPHHAGPGRDRHLCRRTRRSEPSRSSISGEPGTPTRRSSTATRSIAASCLASPASWRSS